MVTFILPGGSAHNKAWAEDTAQKINLNQEVRPVFWSHWEDPTTTFDPAEKVRLIVDVARENQINIIAKSIGTYVAAMIIEKVPEKIQRVVFCGIPLNDINENEKEVYRKVLREFSPEKVVVFQNVEDPHATFEDVKVFLAKINAKIKIVSKDRSDHEYPYFDEFREFLLQGTVR